MLMFYCGCSCSGVVVAVVVVWWWILFHEITPNFTNTARGLATCDVCGALFAEVWLRFGGWEITLKPKYLKASEAVETSCVTEISFVWRAK